MSNFDIALRFFIQLGLIVLACQVVGWIARRIGQSPVVGEMVVGILLGPSLFGALFPAAQQSFFPKESKTIIYVLAQVALVLYMFVIGLEFDVNIIRKRFKSAAWVSGTGILAPFVLGATVTFFLAKDGSLFGQGVEPWLAMLFIGAAMSITAFPVLSRIIHERGLFGTNLGTLALGSASIDDAVSWGLLAIVLASFKSDATIAIAAIGGGALYVVFTLLVTKRVLKPLENYRSKTGDISTPLLALMLSLVMIAAWITDGIGIYAVFGAFIFGTAVPRGFISRELIRRVEPIVTAIFIPLFFINSGLNTQLGLLNDPHLWLVAMVILVVAVIGKGGACWLAARLNGESPRDSMALGALMNARGLVELIALNIGLDQKIISPTMFSIMVLMALVTTFMTNPLFNFVTWLYDRKAARTAQASGLPLPAPKTKPAHRNLLESFRNTLGTPAETVRGRLAFLKKVFIFSSLTDYQLTKTAQIMTTREVEAGNYICRLGDIGNELYIIQKGEVEVIQGDVPDGQPPIVRGEGECIGELAILGKMPRTASIVALTDVSLLVIEASNFDELLRDYPDMAIRLNEMLVKTYLHHTETQYTPITNLEAGDKAGMLTS